MLNFEQKLNVLKTLALAILIALFSLPQIAFAESFSILDSTDDILGTGINNNITQVQEGTGVELESAGYWGALSWRTPDKGIGVGAAFATDGRYVYVVRGVADVLFWRYDPDEDSWEELSNLPKGAYYGADIQYLDGYIYALFGGYQKTFARYSIEDDSWEEMIQYPDLTYQGTSMTTDGTDIYAITGNNTQNFYKYSVLDDQWTPLTGSPLTLNYGADLVYIDGYIYTPRGINTNIFYRYDIINENWTTLSTIPDLIRDDIDITTDGQYIFLAKEYNSTDFYRYEILTNTWTVIASAPAASRYAGVQYLAHDGYVYFFRGNNQSDFWKYDINEDVFIGPADAPDTLRTGSDAFYYNGNVYVSRGYNSPTFYQYNVATNTWSTLTSAPGSFNTDIRGVLAGDGIYMLLGANLQTFYRYNISTNDWDTLTDAPETINYGAALAYPGSGDYIYVTRGVTTTTFWRYSISGDSWDTTISNLPIGNFASFGTNITANATDVFYTGGRGLKRMFEYDIASDTWTEINKVPFAPYYGTDTAYNDDDTILAIAGHYSEELWEYTISTNVWRKLRNLSGYSATSIGPYTGASIVYIGDGKYLVTRGNIRSDVLIYNEGETNFETSGSWVSDTYDLGYVDAWGEVTIDADVPGDSSVTIQTRTSSDAQTWSNWESLSSGDIVSPENRYLQVKFFLYPSIDGEQTPILRDIQIEYTSDENPPLSPTNFIGYSREVSGEEITSGEGYSHTEPYFTWDPAQDSEGSIVGYYVYFGTDDLADPTVKGTFQTGESYRVNQAISLDMNYLIVASEDENGNVSIPTTGFEYNYIGVGPYISVEIDATEMNGQAEGVNIDVDDMKLQSEQGGFWLEASLTAPPTTFRFHYGSKNVAYVESTKKFYIPNGVGTLFYEYDTANNTWTQLADSPERSYYGGGTVEGPDGYIYMAKGENSTEFWRYDISSDTWDTEVSNPPLTIGYGGSLVFDGYQYIYLLRGNNSDTFWRYDTFGDFWETLASVDFGAPSNNINNNAYMGASLTIDTQNKLIYAIQGGLRYGFSVYNIDTNSWIPLDTTPSLPYLGASIEYDPYSNAIYYQGGYQLPYFYKYDLTTQQWIELSSIPIGFYYGGGVHRAGRDLYGIRGQNTFDFFKYDIEKNSWLIPQRGLFGREYEGSNIFTANYGSDIVQGDENYFYIARGNFSDDFIRWNEETGEVKRLSKLPVPLYTGGALLYESENNKIYATGGTYDSGFFLYDIDTNIWTELVDDPVPITTNQGCSMVYEGSRYIYLNRGASNTFYRYDTEGSAGSRWDTMQIAPSSLGYGAELLLKGGYIYTMRGYNQADNPLYRYTIGDDTWTELTPSTFQLYNEGFLVDGNNGYLYAARGVNTREFYRYSLSLDSWEQLPDSPANIYAGGAGESNLEDSIYVIAGSGTGSYSDALYTYVIESENSGFIQEGEYISQEHDLGSIYKFADIVFDYTINDNTNIQVQTATSEDAVSWEGWIDANRRREIEGIYSYKINSTPNRYLKVRILLDSGDGIKSPEIRSYTVNYYQDDTPPTNPNVLGITALSEAEIGVELTSDEWYNYEQPYFEWPEAEEENGASDGDNGSGITGYYVYWGTEQDGDPEDLIEVNTFSPTGLDSGTTYYLRIKTIDDAGNISSTVLDAFTYKFDSDEPLAPDNLAADPSGYTATDSFSFTWDEVVKEGASISEYCYKTGATEGIYSVDQCISENSVDDIPSYRIGVNTFYVRARDEAGNIGSYASVSYFYVDAANAPAPPTNLEVNPVTSTSNSFGFEWDPPLPGTFYGSQSNLSYLYSVNALPTEHSVSTTSLLYLIPGAYATLPGENIFYIVTKDEAGNVNYNDYAQVSFFANTVAPGIPRDMEIADVSVKTTFAWRLAVSWDAPIDEGSGVAGYRIYRSTDGENFSLHTSTGGASLVDSKLEQRDYYYKVQACDSTNNCGAFSEVVKLYPDGRYTQPADIIVEPMITGITPKKATVNWVTDRTSDSKIAYGLNPGQYFEEEVSNSDHVIDHTLTMYNLTPGTIYYYVVKWTDEDGNTGISEESTFETSPPPSLEEPIVKRVGLDNALIEFKTMDAIKVRIFYGETSAFGGMVEVYTGLSEGIHNVELTDLKDGVKYFYKINTFDIDDAEYEGETHSFETLPRPKVSEVKIFQVSGTAASTLLVEWESNTPVSSVITYYPTNAPERARDEVNVALKGGRHRMVLLNLEPNVSYSIIVSGRDFMGNEAVSENRIFQTAADTRPPKIFDLEVTAEIIGSGQEATAQLVVVYKTDELSTSQIEYGEGTGSLYTQKTQEDNSMSTRHVVIVSGLTPGKVYHLRALSSDEAGNLGYSIDKVVVTPSATDSAFNLAVKNLTSLFSFLGRNR
jgi:N-acetylneuraminic acid mutarotase